MKVFTGKKIWQKLIIVCMIFILLFQFIMPVKTYANWVTDAFSDAINSDFMNNVAVAMAQILAAGGDLFMGALNKFMLGTEGFGTAMISNEALSNDSWFNKDADGNDISIELDESLTESEEGDEEGSKGTGIRVDSSGDDVVVYVQPGSLAEGAILAGSDNWEIPNLLYCPENIFGNNIAMLDVNFLNPNDFTSVVESGRGKDTADEQSQSIAGELKDTIKSWYLAFRNIAVVTLLSILVYLGIRILISSTAEDKAKYKETIRDWIIALILVFAMHFIMSATIMIVNRVNVLFNDINRSVYVSYDGEIFRSNFTGVMRFLAQSTDGWDAWAYTIIYLILVVYTISFTVQYLRRLLYIAFYTMISPLVAITYPIDKLGDGKSQAFNKWFKEYVMTMVLQPIHLIIYSMIVSSALTLAIKSPLYAIVAIGFLIQAEQFIKSLFGIESKADGGFGKFAAGALAMNAMNKMGKSIGGSSGGGGSKGKAGGSDDSAEKPKVREANNKELSSLRDGDEDKDDNIGGSSAERLDEAASGVGDGAEGSEADSGEDSVPPLDRGDDNPPPVDSADNNPPLDSSSGGQSETGEKQGSAVGKLFRDTYNNSNFAQRRAEKKRQIKGVKEQKQREKADIKEQEAKKREKQRQIKLQQKQQKQTRLKSQKDNKKFIKQAKREEFANKHPKLSAPGRFTRKLGAAAASDIGRGISGAASGIKGAADKWKANAPKRAIKNAVRKKYLGKKLKTIARPVGKGLAGTAKFAARNGLKLAGGALGAGIGVATGIASGKGLEGAMQGAAAGFAAGGAIGNNTYNLGAGVAGFTVDAARGTANYVKDIHSMHREATLDRLEAIDGIEGTNKAQEYAREHLSKAEKKRYDQIINEYAIQNGESLEAVSGKSKEDLYKDIHDYETHKVYDQDKIIRGLAIEHSDQYKDLRKEAGFENNNKKHDNVVDIMQMTNTFGKQYTTDDKKIAEFDKTLDVDNVRSKKDTVKKVFYAAVGSDWKKAGTSSPAPAQPSRENTNTNRNTNTNSNTNGNS